MPDQLSDNLVALKTTYNDDKDAYLLDITSQTKTENQAELSEDLIRSNYYYSLSNNSKLTPVVDEKIQPFLSKLKNSFSGAYYEAISDEETKPKDIKIKFFGNIKSVIVKKEKVHKTRFEIIYALRYRLFNTNDGDIELRSSGGLNNTDSGSINIGRKNNIDPKRIDKNPVFRADVFDILEAVIAAIATGGVIKESTPQYNTYKWAAIGLMPPSIIAGARTIAKNI